ncbi:MAG: GTPase ObgE [Chloroflexota bacterium]
MADFVDKIKIFVKGGDGGNGCVSFRREKYVPEGGPNGGDGGRGGDVYAIVDGSVRTLMDFRYQRHHKAPRGQHGMGSNMHGKSGEDLFIKVPPGTAIFDDATGDLIADLTEEGELALIGAGGRGGKGNARFASATNTAPRMAEKGEPGEERWVTLELKLLADVGFVGFPNAGKSTLLASVTAAKPKIANYPFTTLVPNLGVARIEDGRSFVLADIPGLIEGASAGAGLGHDFLRHVERTRVLIHVIDAAGTEGRDPVADFAVINGELEQYRPGLSQRPQIVAANKIDLPEAGANVERLKAALEPQGYPVMPISAATGEGVRELMFRVADLLDQTERDLAERRAAERELAGAACAGPDGVPAGAATAAAGGQGGEKVYRFTNPYRWEVARDDRGLVVRGKNIERLAAMTDFRNEEAVYRFQRIMAKLGVDKALKQRGAREGDIVRIGKVELEFSEDDVL